MGNWVYSSSAIFSWVIGKCFPVVRCFEQMWFPLHGENSAEGLHDSSQATGVVVWLAVPGKGADIDSKCTEN